MSTTFTNTDNFTGNLTGTGTNSANTNTGMATGTGTGSWADSTHSVIWMSRSGKSPAMPNTNQPHAAQYASLTVAALLTIAAASNLIDVYAPPCLGRAPQSPPPSSARSWRLPVSFPRCACGGRCCSWRVRSWWSARSSS